MKEKDKNLTNKKIFRKMHKIGGFIIELMLICDATA